MSWSSSNAPVHGEVSKAKGPKTHRRPGERRRTCAIVRQWLDNLARGMPIRAAGFTPMGGSAKQDKTAMESSRSTMASIGARGPDISRTVRGNAAPIK
jgi:hypothetical protein